MTGPEWSPVGQHHVGSTQLVWNEERTDQLIAESTAAQVHMWVAVVGYLVRPPIREGAILDAANMMGRPAIGCYICEEEWSPALNTRRCLGVPR